MIWQLIHAPKPRFKNKDTYLSNSRTADPRPDWVIKVDKV